MENNLPKVAIVGRPNVGKSTLFNRLIQNKVSITSDEKGVTRDRIYHTCSWMDKKFNLVDTGGFANDLNLTFQEEINKQVEIATQEADIIIFLVSKKEGVTAEDQVVAQMLKKLRTSKTFIMAVNKMDAPEHHHDVTEFYQLGFGEPLPLSSIHGHGIADLLDEIVKVLPETHSSIHDERTRIGIIGKPNVGKSTLINELLNDERTIVSPIAGTTRDAIDTLIKVKGNEYVLTDTAGLKKNKKALTDIEWYSELRTSMAIENSDISVLMVDHTQNIDVIDEQIMGVLKEELKPTIIVVNKLDLLDPEDRKQVEADIRQKFKFAPWASILFISAQDRKNIYKIFDKVEEIKAYKDLEISKPQLNDFLIDIQIIKKPPRYNGIEVKLTYITYTYTDYPHFIIFSNHPDKVHFSYERFIENQIRNIFKFDGVPIKITFRKK